MGSNDVFKSLGEVKAEQLGTQGERGDYYNTMATITYFQKDKALYKACPNQVVLYSIQKLGCIKQLEKRLENLRKYVPCSGKGFKLANTKRVQMGIGVRRGNYVKICVYVYIGHPGGGGRWRNKRGISNEGERIVQVMDIELQLCSGCISLIMIQVDGRECNKKVTEGGDGSYRCEKCSVNLDSFKWRLILSLNMGDYSDSIWASCFQVENYNMI